MAIPMIKRKYIEVTNIHEFFFSFSYNAGVTNLIISHKIYGDVINRPKYNEVEKCVINWLLSSVVIRVTSKLSNWKLMSILSNKDSRVLYVTKFESLGAKIISNVLSLK